MGKFSKAALAAAAAFIALPAVTAPPTPVYLAKAGAGDMYEKQSSTLVLQTTRDPQVRKFANMMLMDHTKSTNMVKSAAMRSGLHPKPPMLAPNQRAMLAELRHTPGRARDRVYIDQQKMAHQEALALHRDYAATGSVRALRGAAGNIVPVVEHHIMMLDRM